MTPQNRKGFILTSFVHILACVYCQDAPHANNSFIDGPGLDPHLIVLPCRYFTIHLKSQTNESIEGSSSKLDIKIEGQIFGREQQKSIPIRYDKFYIGTGEFLVRYKLYSTLQKLEISVKFDNDHVRGSPRVIDSKVHPSDCNCPSQSNFSQWLDNFQCPSRIEQIHDDLEPFPIIDMRSGLKEARKRFNQKLSQSYCHYVIKENQIYRQCYGEHVGFQMFPDATLLYLTRVVRLPDTEFLINLGDWPLVKKNLEPAIPMISWCKTNDDLDILLPTYEITEASLECMGRQTLDELSIAGRSYVNWEEKIEKAFFKGRDSSRERLQLIRIAKENGNLIDAGITRYFFFKQVEEELGTVPYSSFYDFFKYKYQINMDGTVAAYRFPYLLAGGSLILKQNSPYIEHFYNSLKPGVHYVPVEFDLSDLVDKIEWAISNDSEAKKIAENAKDFAMQNLLPQNVICYHALLLKEWTRRLVHPVQVLPDMEKVQDKSNVQARCYCDDDGLDTKTVVKDEL